MRYCSSCGGPLQERLLPTEDRPRLVCERCGFILYQNPKIVVGAIPLSDGRAVLVRRGLEPSRGKWTFPGGFLEIGETPEEGAARETREETGLGIEITDLLGVYSRREIDIVVIVYLARIVDGAPTLTRETLEIGSFAPWEIPWDDLAFPTTLWALTDWARRCGYRPPEGVRTGP